MTGIASRYVACLTILLSVASYALAQDSARPNILFLFADDQRADTIAALGNEHIQTPHLDQLARRGLSFNNAYMQGSLNAATCVASRAMLLSGRSVFRYSENMVNAETWPAAFARSGYETFATGKWHNGDRSLAASFQRGEAIFSGGMVNPLRAPLRDFVDGAFTKPQFSEQHSCAMFADQAIEFLRLGHDRPFLCYVAFNGPHDPHIVPAEFDVRYNPAELPLPRNFLPRHPFDNGELSIRDEKLLPSPRREEDVRQMLADYYRYVSYIDYQVGRILTTLEKQPFARNTYIVFSADSGVARGSHGLIGKQNLYEHSIRVPLIIAGPGVAENKRTNAAIYLFDLFPSLSSRCGVKPPEGNEGRDFGQILASADGGGRTELFFAYKNVQRSVRQANWKLIDYPQAQQTQLFELKEDPEETHDLSQSTDHADRLVKLRELMSEQQREYDDPLIARK